MNRITTAARIAPRITVATTNKLPTAATATSPLQEEGDGVSRLSVDGAVVSTTVTVVVVVMLVPGSILVSVVVSVIVAVAAVIVVVIMSTCVVVNVVVLVK